MIRKLLCVAFVLALSAVAFAGDSDVGPYDLPIDNSIIGPSDLIVIGTVVNVDEMLDPNGPGIGDPKQATLSDAKIQVDEVLKGSPVKEFGVKYMAYGKSNRLEANQQRIFFLKRSQNGYSFTGYFDVRDINQLEKAKAMIKAFPLKVSLESAPGPCYFDSEPEIKIKLKNTGDAPIDFASHSFGIEAFSYSPLLKEWLPFTVKMLLADAEKPAAGPVKSKIFTIAAGDEYIATLKLTCPAPKAWQMFTKDTYLQMPVALRINLRTETRKDADNKPIPGSMFMVSSPWSTVMVGYGLPDDINVEKADNGAVDKD